MKFNWFPWRWIIRVLANRHGFIDPITVLSNIQRFAQPSEVSEPIELLRAGMVFHARGLINSRVIQHNLDWIWPYWIERQFDPSDQAFIPRAFSLTHVNLSHRNWTAIGIPDIDELPIIDPRGLLTPFWDKWSLDVWICDEQGNVLLPSRTSDSVQELSMVDNVEIHTRTCHANMQLETHAKVVCDKKPSSCIMDIDAISDRRAILVLALRPYNPEGISFIYNIELSGNNKSWKVDDNSMINFSKPVDHHLVSSYLGGDVFQKLMDYVTNNDIHGHQYARNSKCDVGMATAAAMYNISPENRFKLNVEIPLSSCNTHSGKFKTLLRNKNESVNPDKIDTDAIKRWNDSLADICRLQIPDKQFKFLYDAAIRTIVLCSPGDIYPGPYTYKRFWFRDAAFIIHALICTGQIERAERALQNFPARQNRDGYFVSQYGEWDANGEALWIIDRFRLLSGKPLANIWVRVIEKGANWIIGKRQRVKPGSLDTGLLPAGFSAEHLGPSDYYYWDNFWGIAGLSSAARIMNQFEESALQHKFESHARDFSNVITRNIEEVSERLKRPAIPASPYRRLDAGAIGSIVASYPLNISDCNDAHILDTVEFLHNNCFIDNGFFQDMIHSGINPYLTLHVAQVMLRAGDERYFALMQRVADLASPTGQWPEAVHPRTNGGCMGDGQHAWAAAEWIMMIRNCFVRDEGDRLILASGIPEKWLQSSTKITFGPAPTPFGKITIQINSRSSPSEDVDIHWKLLCHSNICPDIFIRMPGYLENFSQSVSGKATLKRMNYS